MFPVQNDYMKQLASLQAQLQPLQAAQQALNPPEQIKYVDGIAGAKELQSKLPFNSSAIIMDKNDDVFYVISKDANGDVPKLMQIGRFTLETEESTDPQYITKADLDALEKRIIELLKEKNNE